MRLHRFYITEPLPNTGETLTINNDELIHQVKNVLRLQEGDHCIVFNGTGYDVTVEIQSLLKKEMTVLGINSMKNIYEPTKETVLYFSMLKRENTELVIQKATEIGVTTIVPMLSERTVKTGFNKERCERIALEATEQSGRDTIPAILDPISFTKAIESCSAKIKVLYDKSGISHTYKSTSEPVAVFIGPEGGWSDDELNFAKEHAVSVASLPTPILRGETANIIATFLAVARI